jgi:hypothetical protein
MAEAPEILSNPVLGELRWEPKYDWWFSQIKLPSGDWLDVIVNPGDGDRYAFIEPAAKLFRWALDNEQRILADALRMELLELYNGAWRQGDEPVLTADGLAARLEWTLLVVSASDIVPVEFSYAAGELFGYHGVTIEVDAKLRFRDIELRG